MVADLRGTVGRWLTFLILASAVPVSAQVPAWAVGPDSQATKIRLIVRGDDFGLTHASTLAMEEAFTDGIMTSASVMPGAPWIVEAAAIARSHPDLAVGLHLALSSVYDRLRVAPLAPLEEVPSLVAEDGFLFHSYPESPLALEYLEDPPYLFGRDREMPPEWLNERRLRTSRRLPEPQEVEIELRAQIERAKLLGLPIDYLDCHMGIACKPSLAPVLIRLAEELCVPIPEHGWMGHTNIGFYAWEDAELGVRKFVELIESLEPGLYRLVLHPTEDTPEARAVDRYFGGKARRTDLEILTSAAVRDALWRNEVELVSVRDLWDYDRCELR